MSKQYKNSWANCSWPTNHLTILLYKLKSALGNFASFSVKIKSVIIFLEFVIMRLINVLLKNSNLEEILRWLKKKEHKDLIVFLFEFRLCIWTVCPCFLNSRESQSRQRILFLKHAIDDAKHFQIKLNSDYLPCHHKQEAAKERRCTQHAHTIIWSITSKKKMGVVERISKVLYSVDPYFDVW